MYAIDLRTQRNFEVIGFSFHNNFTFLKDDFVMYNGLGIEVPVTEKILYVLKSIILLTSIKILQTEGLSPHRISNTALLKMLH